MGTLGRGSRRFCPGFVRAGLHASCLGSAADGDRRRRWYDHARDEPLAHVTRGLHTSTLALCGKQ